MSGRRKTEPAVIDGEAAEVAGGALVDPAREREINERQQLVVAEFGDGLPWSLTHYEAEIRQDLGRSAESFLRAGRRLLVARACTAHGEWGDMLRRLNLGDDTALHMMAWARQIGGVSNPERVRDLTNAATTIGRMIELAKLPPEQFQALAEKGTTGELALDDVATMTRDELRAAVREARETIAAKDERSAERERKIEKLQRDLSKAKRERAEATPDEVAEQLRDELSRAVMAARAAVISHGEGVRSVRMAVADLVDHGVETEVDFGEFIAGLLQELITDVRIVRDEYGLRIIDEQV